MAVTAYPLDMTRSRTLSVADTAIQTSGLEGVASLCAVQIVVTGTITLAFETSTDRGTTWVATSALPVGSTTTVTSTSSSGEWTVDITGKLFRVRCSAVTGGSAVTDRRPVIG